MVLVNRDAIEDDLKKELRQLKQTLAEAANAQQMQKGAVDEQKQANETHKTEMAAAHSQIVSLTRDVSALRAQLADHASVVERNKQLNSAVAELDKAFANAEKRVRLAQCFRFLLLCVPINRSFFLQLDASAATVKQFELVRKSLEEKCADVPKLQKENVDLKNKLKESMAVAAELAKVEQIVKSLAVEREKFRADAAAATEMRKEMTHLKVQLEASAVALLQKESAVAKLNDEIMAMKLQALLKQRTEKHDNLNVEAAKELLEDVSFWRKKCIKAEAALHDIKVTIAADARRSFLALAIDPRTQQQDGLKQIPSQSTK
jgi:hypothetical protein